MTQTGIWIAILIAAAVSFAVRALNVTWSGQESPQFYYLHQPLTPFL